MSYRLLLAVVLMITSNILFAQKVVYTEPNKDDSRQTKFEIIGRLGNSYHIYKNTRESHAISIYDANMKEVDRVKLDLPERIINTDFIAFPDFSYMIYQYQKRNIVYCMADKIDAFGKKVGETVQLDTTQIGFMASNKIYSIIYSDNKQQIVVFKINNKNEKTHILTTSIFNKELTLQNKDILNIEMPDRNDLLTEFHVDDEGNLIFTRAVHNQNDNIQKLFLITKPFGSTTITEREVGLKNIYLDDIRLKVDNYNKRYVLTSFYSKSRQGNIEGLYIGIMDRASWNLVVSKTTPFTDQLRAEARGESSTKTAFNDYFLRNIIVKRDGGFLMAAEAFYSTGRGNYNRNYYYGSPFMRSYDYYTYSPFAYSYPWSSWNSFGRGSERYHAENIAVFAFDSTGNMGWSNIINKNQFDDDADIFIGYTMVNTGDQLHFLYNMQEKRTQLLTSQTIVPGGQLNRNPTIKNLDKGYEFMPRLAKQVGNRQVIFPCMYRNYLCFAKLEL